MKRLLVLAAIVVPLLAPVTAMAHPLGNFTVNRYSRVEASGDRLYVLYVLDMAEIPTFQERQKITNEKAYARAQATRIGAGLRLTIDGRPLPLRPESWALAFPPGVAGLQTLRLQAVYSSESLSAAGRTRRITYRDTNFAGRIGWKEVVFRARDGAQVISSTAPAKSVSQETLSYPKDLLSSPLDVTEMEGVFRPGGEAGPAPTPLSASDLAKGVTVRATGDRGFAALIGRDELTPPVVLLSLLVALFWGAAHAFSPGHGKAIVAAYLVGSHGTPRHALYLGLIVTATHTIGVFALGFVTLALSEFIVPDQLYPWLNLVSALLVIGVGIAVLRWRLREWRRRSVGHGHSHSHSHSHSHDLPHQQLEPGGQLRGLVSMGISGGIIPCPTALVVLLAAISLHRVAYGLVLILAFSVGLAAAMTAIGIVAVSAKRVFSRIDFERGAVRLLPAVSAVVIVGFGLVMTARAVPALT